MKIPVILLLSMLAALPAAAQLARPVTVRSARPEMGQNVIPAELRGVAIEQKLNEQAPLDLVFRDESGNDVRLGQYFGKKPVVLTLVYYDCPMLCTMVLNGLVRSLRAVPLEVGRDFEVVTVSFDPRETPELARGKKQSYVERYGRPAAAGGWHFLTGGEDSIRRLTESVGFRYTFDEKTGQFAHASALIVLTPAGKIARYFYGVEYSARDLRLGLVEASNHRIGTLADQVLLFCYHYDPVQGKYGLAIMRAIRAAGLATVLMLGGFVLVMLRREKSRTAT